MVYIYRLGKKCVCVCLVVFICMVISHAAMAAGKRKPLAEGNYHGTLTIHAVQGQANRAEEVIRAEVKKVEDGISITVKDFKNQSVLMEPLSALHWRNCGIVKPVIFDFTFPSIQATPIQLQQVDKSEFRCFSGSENYEIEFCMDDEGFTIEIKGKGNSKISITGTQFEIQPPLVNETPRVFKLSEAIDIALNKNLDIKIGRETMIRAKLMSKRAKLNLLPHFGYGTIADITLGLLFKDPTAILEVATEVVPFLFPANVIDVRIQKWQAKAEEMAFALLRANTAVSVEQLAINYVELRNLRDEILGIRAESQAILDEVSILESRGLVEKGSTDLMQINVDKVRENYRDAEHRLHDTAEALSALLGFNNPEVVKDVILDEYYTPVEDIPILDDVQEAEQKEDYAQYAIQNSLELKQQQFLERAAKDNEIKLYLTWFSPGSDNLFGFTFTADLQIARSARKGLMYVTTKIRKSLKSQAYDDLKERNEWRREYVFVERSLTLRRRLWIDYFTSFQKKMESLDTKPEFNVGFAKDVLENLAASLAAYHNMRGVISICQAGLDRLALRGPYHKLLPRIIKGLQLGPEDLQEFYEEKILASR